MRGARIGTLFAVGALLAGLLGTGGSAAGAGGPLGGTAGGTAGGGRGEALVHLAAGAPENAPENSPENAPGNAVANAVEADGCDTGASLPPKEQVGSRIRAIRERGYLVVGIDQSAYNWGYRDSQTGRIEGFDIDLAHAVAGSVLGDPDKVRLKAVATADRVALLQAPDRPVDMIARAMTITCDRLKQIAFSAPYFNVSQRVVAPKSAHAGTVDQALRGKDVCVAENSSSAAALDQDRHGARKVLTPENQLDCLVLMELGEAQATLSDSSLAYAMVAQDQTMQLVDGSFLPTYMGVGMNKQDTDLVAWVNQVLADWRNSGGWQASYDKWLRPTMGDPGPYRPW
ncbi:hypothetical protein GCM10009759_78630 [Kitasatospora saccharophila]|uniref:Solute-binding protein family 3/N-terminal domain-containing protein n=1 Tax=Kitasatospora saccharophila TaxID=407973 RepID=A0ABP5K464_9ACTN